MKQALKAEYLKLITYRSTYIISALVLGIVAFLAFYVEGIRATGPIDTADYLSMVSSGAVNAVAGILALVGILQVTREYRYNTIIYTLASARRRHNVLIAKVLVVSGYALLMGLIVSILAPLLASLALNIRDAPMAHQVIAPFDLLWRNLFAVWGFTMLTFVISQILRSQVAAIVALFILPSTIEPLLGLLLKGNAVYLPFNALIAVLNKLQISPARGAVVVALWVTAGLIASWQLFKKRDAN